MVKLKEVNKDEILEAAIKDLVQLSIKANRVITNGSFPGYMSDEVSEVLILCEELYKRFAREVKEEETHGKK